MTTVRIFPGNIKPLHAHFFTIPYGLSLISDIKYLQTRELTFRAARDLLDRKSSIHTGHSMSLTV